MSTLMQASRQWATRPDDQRFISLTELDAHCSHQRSLSRDGVRPSRSLKAEPAGDTEHKGLVLAAKDGRRVDMTHWSFGQLSRLAGAPTGYLRTLAAPLAADCINYGLQITQPQQDAGMLIQTDSDDANRLTMRALTGPKYGRVWNSDITRALVQNFGDGLSGRFKVPGEFGKRVQVTKANTTLYASDRDMFVFLADEENRIEIPNRRNGETGSLARGFFIWNSEVGSTSLGVCTFLFDYVCCNRIVWGAEDVKELRIRHSSGAPEKFISDVTPALIEYSRSSATGIKALIENSRKAKIGDADAVDAFLRERFTNAQSDSMKALHQQEEGRPIETLWDVSTGVTAYARGVAYQDERISIEREAGKVLKLAA